ncbi:cobyrinate a,c-diamide synthase [Thermodesulfobacteriota bacterium]
MQQEGLDFPRILISALRGGSGKTILSVGIIAAWKALGKSTASFKKGPDYIDAGWLALASGRSCYNLDTFLIPPEKVLQSFLKRASNTDIAVIEGNRGLYDGIDIQGSTSTAELAKLLEIPVVMCINCTKTTRTMAAALLGCIQFDSDVRIEGAILNQVAGLRHEQILRRSIEHYCGIPVLGAVPKLSQQNFPERHMGLVPTPEHEWAQGSVDAAARIAEKYLDLDTLFNVANKASPLKGSGGAQRSDIGSDPFSVETKHPKPIIGIIKDSAFQFYYPENIEALELAGAKLVFVSPLKDPCLPKVDALYIGGGFPETHVGALAENIRFRRDIKAMAEDGLPIYAECGGLMYLGQELVIEGKPYPMADVLPIVCGFSQKPQGHGYTIFTVEGDNPFFEPGTEIRGHEFHYSSIMRWGGHDRDLVFRMQRGKGVHNGRDGVRYKNVLATYSHIHALGTPEWAEAVVRNAGTYRRTQKKTG